MLVFAVPNSSLAQPWSAVVGNATAAAVGVAACMLIPDAALRIALAVGLSVALMILLRAVHPPAGAVAMTAAMNPEAAQKLGSGFVLAPVLAGTLDPGRHRHAFTRAPPGGAIRSGSSTTPAPTASPTPPRSSGWG